MLHLTLAADVAVAETDASAAVQRVDRCSSQIDSCTAVDHGRARIESLSRGMAAPLRARCTQPPSPKKRSVPRKYERNKATVSEDRAGQHTGPSRTRVLRVRHVPKATCP
eukprot:7377398-Prymnesium_polylepis.3